MNVSLPVWSTTKTILAYCWQERGLAIKYAALPVIFLVLVNLGGSFFGVKKSWEWEIVTDLAAILAYAPFTVTWFQGVVLNDTQARTRPLVTFAALEKGVIAMNIRIAVVVSVIALLLVIAVGFPTYLLAQVAPNAWQVAALVLGFPALFFWVLVITRVSLSVAYAAAGEHLNLRDAWKITTPFGFALTWVHIILATIDLAILGTIAAILNACGLPIGFGGSDNGPPNILAEIMSSIVNTLGGIVYLIFVTTLYGFVYRLLKAQPNTAS